MTYTVNSDPDLRRSSACQFVCQATEYPPGQLEPLTWNIGIGRSADTTTEKPVFTGLKAHQPG